VRFPLLIAAALLLALPRMAAAQDAAADVAGAFSRAGMPLLKEKAPNADFTLPLLDGTRQTLSGLKGSVVFLNFWATWCPPCREEMPAMEKLYQRFKSEGLEFLTVNIQEDKKTVEAFMKQMGLSFPVALDSGGDAAALYGIRGIPTTYILGRDGAIIAAAVGGREWDSQAMMDAFGLLLRHGR
jgi:thiol-disulfide isomerase/thioredoxin